VRVGPRLVASSDDGEGTALLLTSLTAGLACSRRCGRGDLCAVCAARAVEATAWTSCAAPALACCENDEGVEGGLADLTRALLLAGGALGGAPGAVADAAAATSGRATQRTLRVAGVELTFAQQGSFDSGRDGGGGGDTGMVLWGAHALLAWFLEHDGVTRAALAAGAPVIELGCGLGSVAAAAAILGGRVLATDGDAHVVEAAAENLRAALSAAAAAGVACPAGVQTARLRWGNEEDWAALAEARAPGPFQIVLACDCGFFAEAHGALADTLARLVGAAGTAGAPPATLLMAHTWRRLTPERAFFSLLASRGFVSEDVTPSPQSGAPLPGCTQLLRLRLAAAAG